MIPERLEISNMSPIAALFPSLLLWGSFQSWLREGESRESPGNLLSWGDEAVRLGRHRQELETNVLERRKLHTESWRSVRPPANIQQSTDHSIYVRKLLKDEEITMQKNINEHYIVSTEGYECSLLSPARIEKLTIHG